MGTHAINRFIGSLVGLACGDAVGTAVEFKPRGSFTPLTDMIGGGVFDLWPGQWTDDTSMALCLAESLLTKNGFDAADQMGRYLNWWQWGYLSSTGECFDIGITVKTALQLYQSTKDPFCGTEDPSTAGNGGLMRLAPVVMYYFPDYEKVQFYAVEATRTTHGAPEALDCTRLLAHMIFRGLEGASKEDMLDGSSLKLNSPKVEAIALGAYVDKKESEIFGTGYSVASLEAALWCFKHSTSFEQAVLIASNLGDDADTTAAIVGQIAGAHYGFEGIPKSWFSKLYMGKEIIETANQLAQIK